MTHHNELLIHVFTVKTNVYALVPLFTPKLEIVVFILTFAEKEDTSLWI
jgi:hypothetical protein